jgi:hypothetical protein
MQQFGAQGSPRENTTFSRGKNVGPWEENRRCSATIYRLREWPIGESSVTAPTTWLSAYTFSPI